MARIEKFWHDLLPHEPSNITIQNKSSDVFVKDCFGNFDTTACVRNSFLTFLGFMSFFFCIIRIAKLHVLHHPQIHQYLIFYLATLEVIFLIVKWIALMSLYQLEFVASFLKMVQFILLCHFHWSLVSRILHQQKIINWVIMPLLAAFLSFFALITAFGLLTHFSTWDYCLAPHWVLLSFAEFLGIQLYVIAGIYITKKINSVSALDSFKWEQKRDLWSVIVVYEFSSVVSLSYYSTLQGLGTFETGCSGIFDNAQNIYSPVYVAIMMIKYLGPIWIMLLVFYPTRGCLSSEDQRLLGLSCDGSTTSTFNPGSRFQDSYKQLILPVQNDLNFVSQEYPPLRRSASSPAFFSKSPLSPIYEDMILPPARVPVPNYGAMDSCSSQPEYVVFKQSRTRSRHDSGIPSKNPKGKALKIVSLNQCSDEMESITPSPSERV